MVRGPVRPALQRAQPPVGQLRAVGEAGLEQLGAQVVVVEHELGAVQQREGPARSARRCPAGCRPGSPRTGPMRRALSVSQAVARNEYAYSATKLSLLPPGAYGRYLYSSTVSMTSYDGSPLPLGHTTATW